MPRASAVSATVRTRFLVVGVDVAGGCDVVVVRVRVVMASTIHLND